MLRSLNEAVPFQFQYGSIDSCEKVACCEIRACLFQFQYGSIDSNLSLNAIL